MATIVEVLSNHPDYAGAGWTWNDNAIDPQNQAELDQNVTRGNPPSTRPLFEWDPASGDKPLYSELHNRRAETNEIIADNQSGDTARDRESWLGRAATPEGVDEGFRRVLYMMEQQNLFIRDLIVEIRRLGGTVDRVIDPTVDQRWQNFLNQSRKFDPNQSG